MMMAIGILWTTLVLHGVVDQLYDGAAQVEWEQRADGWLPLALLPEGVAEGDEVELRLRTRRRWTRPTGPLADVEVPLEALRRRP
ncbi:MAG: hypothetical protein JXX28_04965 [Deltaproteobacteria bacterium]|nr:hypothetical protein [Deltaproteobacteria bacterium]